LALSEDIEPIVAYGGAARRGPRARKRSHASAHRRRESAKQRVRRVRT